MLRVELGDLQAAGFDLALTGFDQDELDRLLVVSRDRDADPDEAPEPPAEPISKPGDLWICGDHRVLCGDATVLADVEKVLGGELADMCFTDSPYNVKLRRALDRAVAARGASLAPWSVHDLRRTVATGLQRLGLRLEVTEAGAQTHQRQPHWHRRSPITRSLSPQLCWGD